MSRPSDGFELDELRDEFDWMYEFNSRMAERIRGDADVHNLVDYVTNLESDNAKLRELLRQALWARDDADWASIVSKAIGMGVELHA